MSESVLTINSFGDKYWRNENGELHRLDGPAIVWSGGSKFWYINGEYHRLDGPAIERVDGSKEWWVEGKKYSEDSTMVQLIKAKRKRYVGVSNE
jgi:hypothetical protein